MKVTIQQKIAMAALGSASLLALACGSGTVTDPDSDTSAEIATMMLETSLDNATLIDSMMTECAKGTINCTEGGDTKAPSSSSTAAASSADAASSSGAAVASSSSTAVVASSSSNAPIASSSSAKGSSSSAAVVSSSSSATTASSSSAAVSSSSASGSSTDLKFTYDGAAQSLTANIEYTATFSAPSYNPSIAQGQLVCSGSGGNLTFTSTDTTFTTALTNQLQIPLKAQTAKLLATSSASCQQKW